MPAVTIRNLSDETHRALKVRAAQHNRSTEAEIRAILEAAVQPEGRLRLGTALAEMSRNIGLTNGDVEALEQHRNTAPAKPLRLTEPRPGTHRSQDAALKFIGKRPSAIA